MQLIDIYIQEVTRRLPEKNRKDIALELRSTIEDMLPEDYTEKDVKAVLDKLGNPASLARSYRDWPQHLIGPRYFDLYTTILKMFLPIVTIVVLISFIAGQVIGFNSEESVLNVVITIIVRGFVTVLEVCLQVFFWTTLCFAVAERFDSSKDQEPLTLKMKKWSADDLKDIPLEKRSISKFEAVVGLFWTAVWVTVYYYADHLVGIYENSGNGLVFITPIFNQSVLLSFLPAILLIVGLEVLFSLYKLYEGKWTLKMGWFNAAFQLISTIVFIMILNTSNLFNSDFVEYIGQAVSDGWLGTLKRTAVFIYIIAAVYNAYAGFRRAKR